MNTFRKIYNFAVYKLQFYILTVINYLVPKSANIVFVFDKRFRKDNAWAITEYLSSEKKYRKYKIYYYTEGQLDHYGNIKVVSNGLLALFYQLRAKYIFYSYRDMKYFRATSNQFIVYTMHGVPLKNAGYLTGTSQFKRLYGFENTFTHIICTSDYFKDIVKRCFGASEKQCIVSGYPRNDVIYSRNDCLKSLSIQKEKYTKIGLWMPTYRARSRSGAKVDSNIDFPLLNKRNIIVLNEFLHKEKILLVIKPHPNQVEINILKQDYSNIRIVENSDLAKVNIFLYQLFSEVDLLLTDYSSAYFDFLLTLKPIGFVIDDFQAYEQKRGFTIDDPFQIMPGEKIYTMSQLITFLRLVKYDQDNYLEDRKKINDLVNRYQDGNTCRRLVKYLDM